MKTGRPTAHGALKLSALGFGGSGIGNLGRIVPPAEARETLQTAWDAGIRYFDTAPHYGRGLSEVRIGRFLADKPRHAFVVSSKVGRVLRPGPQLTEADGFHRPLRNAVHYDYSADGLKEALDGSLDRLQMAKLDIVLVHDIGIETHGAKNAKHVEAFLDSGLAFLQRQKARGHIKAWGFGVNEVAICNDMLRHTDPDIILLAGRLTLLDRSGVGLAQACMDRNIPLILGGIFNSGILATPPGAPSTFNYRPAKAAEVDRAEHLRREVGAVGMTLPQAALQFGLQHPAMASVLLGTGCPEELRENLAATAPLLSPQAMSYLAEHTGMAKRIGKPVTPAESRDPSYQETPSRPLQLG